MPGEIFQAAKVTPKMFISCSDWWIRLLLTIMQMRLFLDHEKRLYGHERGPPALMTIRERILLSTRQGCAAPVLKPALDPDTGVPTVAQRQ